MRTGGDVESLRGRKRIALTGRNGIGKTTLLDAIAAQGPKVPSRTLPQRLDIFDESLSVFENVAHQAPHALPEEIRAQLARFSAAPTPTSLPPPCPAANGCAPHSRCCCSPNPRHVC